MPKNCWKIICVWFCLYAFCFGLSANTNTHFSIANWTSGAGLPQNSVFSIIQTRDRYLWTGTLNGLARFDGVRFTTFAEDNTPGLDSARIVKLFEDHRGNLWIGTRTGSILFADLQGKMTLAHPARTETEGIVTGFCEDRLGGVWFVMAKGQLYYWRDGSAHQISDHCEWLIAEDSGVIWTLGSMDKTLKGIGPVLDSAPWTFPVSFEVPLASAEFPVATLDFLLASRQGGYWRLANGKIEKWKKDQRVLSLGSYAWNPSHPVNAAAEDPQGNLVVGTGGDGVFWFDAQGHFVQISKAQGLAQETVLSLCFDHQGDLWVGTDGRGLNRIRPQIFEPWDETREWGATSISFDGKEGLWLGCYGDGVKHLGLKDRSVKAFGEAEGFTHVDKYVVAVLAAQDQVWAGTVGGSLFRYQSGSFVPEFFFAGARVSALYEDQQGRVLAGTRAGLARREGGSWEALTPREGMSVSDIRALAQDNTGRLWIGTEGGGLYRLSTNKVDHFGKKEGLPSDNIRSLLLDSRGSLWVGTSSGLARFKDDRWMSYSGRGGMPHGNVGYLLEDDAGLLWIGSYAGLLRVRIKELDDLDAGAKEAVVVRSYGEADGLPSAECLQGSQPAACRTPDGRLWFPTTEGIVSVDPKLLRENTNPPPVVIESVLIDEKGTNRFRAPVPKAIVVPAGAESLVIHFASLNLSAPDQGSFKYWMENHEKAWTWLAGTERSVRYSKLPHGQYTFHVRAYNEDGIGDEQGASLAVTVLPPFWQTWWFLTVVSLGLLGFVVGSVHYVSTQKLQRQLAALRQQEALELERARIARDLHDQLGANLTQVALLGELAETDKELPNEVEAHARQIAHTARETTRALDEIVWTVNPSNDTLDELINYICKYAQEYLALAGLRYRIEVPPQLPKVPISPEVRHNVFLAAKESVNNVVKHAKASSAWLRLQLEADRFVLEIEDNGQGLSPEAEKKGRNGLRNMRQRMEAVNGKFEVSPGQETGTRVRLTAPLGNSHA